LSVPVAFQYPEVAALFGLAPFGYFRSLGLKKYHSCSPNVALAAKSYIHIYTHEKQKLYIYTTIFFFFSFFSIFWLKLNILYYLGVPMDQICKDQLQRLLQPGEEPSLPFS
jgi:hypothetical protein